MSNSGPNWSSGLVPPNLTLAMLSQSAGGVLAQTTYFVVLTLLNALGETIASVEQSFLVSANNVLNVASPSAENSGPLPGLNATGWNVYVGTVAGGETKQNGAPIAIGTPWVEPTTGLIAGAKPPVTNTTYANPIVNTRQF